MNIRKDGIKFRGYESQLGFTNEFEMIRKLMVEANSNKITNTNFLWARWEWAISLMYMMDGSLEHNGLWFDADNDFITQKIAKNNGLIASQESEKTSAIEISDKMNYKLPEGFKFIAYQKGMIFINLIDICYIL